MIFDFSGKRAAVCGSTQGMGKATAILLSELGAEVVLISRNLDSLKKTKLELSVSNDQNHDILCADFSDPNKLKENLTVYLEKKLPIHILINNTGGPPPGEITAATSDDFLDGFYKHVLCNQILVKEILPFMKKEKFGRIVNIISTSVKQPIIGLGVSNTIRGAVGSWAKTLASEVAPFGITVNNLLPGATNTNRLDSLFKSIAKKNGVASTDIKKEWIKDIPVGRIAEPEEIAYAIVFLVSEYAGYINGINLPVDGGRLQCL